MKPLVSVLIPCYNSEKWLTHTLKSALSQTWREIEIIIVNDGSTDDTLLVAKQFESINVRIINQENRGQSAAENRALQEAQGEFIQYLDADDLLAPDKIERQLALLASSDVGLVAAGEWARFYRLPEEALFIPQPMWNDFSPVDWLIQAWEGHYMMHGAAWLIPRSIAERAGFWNEELSLINDFEYFSRVLLASQGVKFCWGAKTYYRSGIDGSLSGSKSYSAWKSAFRSLELGTQHLLNREDSTRTRHACATVFQRFIYEVYPDAPDLQLQAEGKVEQYGGSDVKPIGGKLFQVMSSILGWQQAKQMQSLVYRYGYRKAAIGWRLSQLFQKLTYSMHKANSTQ